MRPIRYILISLAFASFVSCSTESGGEDGGDAGESKTIVFTLSSSSPATGTTRGVTRAIDDPEENEKKINRLDVFFYDADGNCLFYPEEGQLKRDASQKVTITLPEDIYNNYLLGESCTIFLVANTNLTRGELSGLSLSALNGLVMENGEGGLFNLATAPEDFLMTGQVPATITAENQNLGTVSLKRAAAKIVVDISSAVVDGYTPGKAKVRISNYVEKTRLGSETAVAARDDYKTSGWREMSEGNEADENPYFMESANAFYSYYNDWSADTDGTTETYITLELEWYRDGFADPVIYYYRIPFSYIDAAENAELHKNRIRRNYIYQFMVNISELGGIDPEDAVDLAANFDVIEWTDRKVDVSILSYHYLFVYNSQMQIHEQSSYEWEYRSSIEIDPVTVVSVECEEYRPDGSSHRVTYNSDSPQYPRFTERKENGRTYFTAHSMVPVNYVPLVIRLEVSNDAELFSNVSLIIFPKRYVTASRSNNQPLAAGSYTSPNNSNTSSGHGNNNPNGATDQTNFNFYRITTTSLDAADEARGIMIGDPTENIAHPAGGNYAGMRYNRTLTDNDSQNIISPEFIVASQRGITSPLTWENAQERCARYRESQYGAGKWRVPTFAELAMLGDMQNDDNSAIKNLFADVSNTAGWWTARQRYHILLNDYTYDTEGGVVSANANGTAYTRCVHDTWRD